MKEVIVIGTYNLLDKDPEDALAMGIQVGELGCEHKYEFDLYNQNFTIFSNKLLSMDKDLRREIADAFISREDKIEYGNYSIKLIRFTSDAILSTYRINNNI